MFNIRHALNPHQITLSSSLEVDDSAIQQPFSPTLGFTGREIVLSLLTTGLESPVSSPRESRETRGQTPGLARSRLTARRPARVITARPSIVSALSMKIR